MAMILIGTLPFIGRAAWKKHRAEPMYCKYCHELETYTVCKTFKLNSESVYLREMMHDPDLCPNRFDRILDCWASNIHSINFKSHNNINLR